MYKTFTVDVVKIIGAGDEDESADPRLRHCHSGGPGRSRHPEE